MVFRSNENDNNNANAIDGKRKRLPIHIIDAQAERLMDKYNNPEGKLLYCKAYSRLEPDKLIEFEKRADTGKHPGRLFTTLVSEELHRIASSSKFDPEKLDKFRRNYGR